MRNFYTLILAILFVTLLGLGSSPNWRLLAQPSQINATSDNLGSPHTIHLQIQQVTPIEEKEGVDLYELKVHRWYDKTSPEKLELNQKHDTQEFLILYPAVAGTEMKTGDILTYKLVQPPSEEQRTTASSSGSINQEKTAWTGKCLKDFEQIKPGMKRAEIEKMFPQDGGISTPEAMRFVHPECPCIKVDVEFSFQRNENDQGRAIRSPEDPVTKVSKPYIEWPVAD